MKKKIKKIINDYANEIGNVKMLITTQKIRIKRKKIIVRTHSAGSWIGKRGATIIGLKKHLLEETGRYYDIDIKDATIWK